MLSDFCFHQALRHTSFVNSLFWIENILKMMAIFVWESLCSKLGKQILFNFHLMILKTSLGTYTHSSIKHVSTVWCKVAIFSFYRWKIWRLTFQWCKSQMWHHHNAGFFLQVVWFHYSLRLSCAHIYMVYPLSVY